VNPDSGVVVERASVDDLDALAPLFSAYRDFYREPPDRAGDRAFLEARLRRGESTVFLARSGGVPVGFMQLYPTFSSTARKPLWILNDLYVVPAARRRGVASLLLDRAKELAIATGAEGVTLETAVDNPAQRLYEARGWRLDRAFLHFEWRCP
jgi:ribosomal protein S18 acetylase RimI-like enzyme